MRHTNMLLAGMAIVMLAPQIRYRYDNKGFMLTFAAA